MSHIAAEVAEELYLRWNEEGLAALTDRVHPDIELVCDALRPVETALHGLDGWRQWVARWDGGYEKMQITTDGVIPMGDEHALALVSITATPRGSCQELHWAAAHLWSIRDGRIARWESHVDLDAARGTLLFSERPPDGGGQRRFSGIVEPMIGDTSCTSRA